MRKALMAVLVLGLILTGVLQSPVSRELRAETPKKTPPTPPAPAVKIGEMAPDFTLKYFDGKDLKEVSLKDYRGKKNVVLAFYIFAFTGG
jgi:cytochrome oxidase Cu insertion factor (SCO1/SenC/PrrC family)